ncbi:MAG: RRXRR domain-containing protein [Desulfobacterales bacterium]|nr:RRXRR domain-containing protein [Desulfobacterales bacterium]
MIRLGIDYGGKYTGIGVVDTRNNHVLYAKTVRMRSDIPDKYEQRRALRSMRRCRKTKKRRLRDLRKYLDEINLSEVAKKRIYRLSHKRGYDYREYDPEELLEQEENLEARHREEVLQDIRAVLSSENATEEQIKRIEDIINKQYRPERFKNRILTKCKICGKNTPLKRNVRDLLIENILMDLPVTEEQKQFIRNNALTEDGKERLKPFFRRVHINEFLRKQTYDIAEGKLSGRTVFCKDHMLEHHKFTKVPKTTVRVLPSTKVKIDNVVKIIESEILPKYKFQEVVMEANNFDVSAKTRGRSRLKKDEYQKGHVKKEKGLVEVLYKEFKGHCVYCGNKYDVHRMTRDHIYPKKKGGLNIYANLVLACKDCNGKKKGRTPVEWGVMPKIDVVNQLENDLKKKILLDSTQHDSLDFNRYMGQASIGWRHLSDRLRQISGNNLPIRRKSGLVTAHFRKWWGFVKEKGHPVHHALDAVILASHKDTDEVGMVDMTLKPDIEPEKMEKKDYLIEFRAKQDRKSSQLHDQNPVSSKNGIITQRKMVTEIKRGKENRIVNGEYRKKVILLFDKYDIKNGKCPNDKQARELGCKRLKCYVIGTGPSQLAKLKNNHYKVATPNDSVIVAKDNSGNTHVILRKNRYLRKHMQKEQVPDGFIIDKVFRRGDQVADSKGDIFIVKKLGKSLVIANREGVEKTKTPKALKPLN